MMRLNKDLFGPPFLYRLLSLLLIRGMRVHSEHNILTENLDWKKKVVMIDPVVL